MSLTCSHHTRHCQCSLESQHHLMLAFFTVPSSSSQCSAEAGWALGLLNKTAGLGWSAVTSAHPLPLHRVHSSCSSAQVHPRPSQDLDLVQLSHSASRHKTHGDRNSWIYFEFHELALQQLYLISSAPGAGCPARITLLFNHIGRAALPMTLQCSWYWVVLGQAAGFLAALTHVVSAVRAQTPVWLTTLSFSGTPFVSLPSLMLPPPLTGALATSDLLDEEHCRSFQVAIFPLQRPQQSGWAQMDGLCSSTCHVSFPPPLTPHMQKHTLTPIFSMSAISCMYMLAVFSMTAPVAAMYSLFVQKSRYPSPWFLSTFLTKRNKTCSTGESIRSLISAWTVCRVVCAFWWTF